MRTAIRMALAGAVAAAAMGTVIAATVEDDLAVVRRAVQTRTAPASSPKATLEVTGDETRLETRRALSSRDLRWFKVRITEKGEKKARVNINLPIALVRALGDDFPINISDHARGGRWRDGDRRDRGEHVIRLGDVLGALEAGQSLVEIDDDDATVRVWVE